MSEITFFTPSYRGDLERFLLLRKSIRHFYRGGTTHIVAVPRNDAQMFRGRLEDDDVTIISEQDYVADRFYASSWYSFIQKVLPGQAWRFNRFAGRPGWIIQQIIKLSIPEIISEGAVVVLDSDLVFMREFDDTDFGITGENLVLVRIEPESESAKQRAHIEKSRQILGLGPGSTEHHYMAWPAILYPDWVARMRQHIEELHHKPWQDVLFEAGTFSEYSIYGTYLEEIVKPTNLALKRESFDYIVWDYETYRRLVSKETELDRKYLCFTVQSNLKIPVNEYCDALESMWQQTPKELSCETPNQARNI